jgi:hypothetical protein
MATRVKRMRSVYEAAIDWRRRVMSTERMIEVIDVALATETEEAQRG